MSAGDFHKLLSRLLDDDITDSDIDSLTEYVVAHPEAALELRMHLRLSEMLASELTWSRSAEAFVRSTVTRLQAEESGDEFTRGMMQTVAADARQEARRRFPRRAALALAASALVVAGGMWLWNAERGAGNAEGEVVARVAEVASGKRQVAGGVQNILRVGDTVCKGTKIHTGADGRVTLAWVGDATIVDVGGDSKLEIGNSKLARLETGRLAMRVDKQAAGKPFVIETLHARATVLGTKLSLDAEPTLTQLGVTDGSVRLRSTADGREVDVPAGRWVQALRTGGFVEGAIGEASAAGLQGWWKLDETGSGPLSDSSGHGLHGTLGRDPYGGSGKRDAGLVLNGSNTCVEIPAALNPGSNSWTVALSFRLKTVEGGSRTLYCQYGLYEARVKDGRLQYIWPPSHDWAGGFSFPVDEGRWHHAAVVYDKTRQALYRDGVLVFSQALTGDMGSNTNRLVLGARAGTWAPFKFFNGELADVRIYSRALSAAEVAALASRKQDR